MSHFFFAIANAFTGKFKPNKDLAYIKIAKNYYHYLSTTMIKF